MEKGSATVPKSMNGKASVKVGIGGVEHVRFGATKSRASSRIGGVELLVWKKVGATVTQEGNTSGSVGFYYMCNGVFQLHMHDVHT